MTPSSAAKVDGTGRQINISGVGADSNQIPQTPAAESNGFKQMEGGSSRISKVLTFFSNIRSLGKFSIAWVKEIPQKIAINKFKIIERNAGKAIEAAVTNEVFEKQLHNISKFLECIEKLKYIDPQISKVPTSVRDSCLKNLGDLVPKHFSELDGILRSIDNNCSFFGVDPELLKQCRLLRSPLREFIKNHAGPDNRQLIESQFRYSEN